jgi:hypothetical protein
MTDHRRAAMYDSVWAKIENDRLRQRIEEENKAAEAFDTNLPTDELVPSQDETWGAP